MNAETSAWAEQEWVPEPVRRRQRRVLGIFLVGVSVSGVPLLVGTSANLFHAPVPVILGILGAAILIAIAAMIATPYVAPYRACSEPMPSTVFHVSPALWEEGETVTLEVARCRKGNRQYVADRPAPPPREGPERSSSGPSRGLLQVSGRGPGGCGRRRRRRRGACVHGSRSSVPRRRRQGVPG